MERLPDTRTLLNESKSFLNEDAIKLDPKVKKAAVALARSIQWADWDDIADELGLALRSAFVAEVLHTLKNKVKLY